MKPVTILALLCFLLLLTNGCQQKEQKNPPETPVEAGVVSTTPPQFNTREITEPVKDSKKLSPLEYAQKEYLDAYNEYVRLLRESGPQTIETLQSLAMYQKKYQIYQMLLKAEGDKKN